MTGSKGKTPATGTPASLHLDQTGEAPLLGAVLFAARCIRRVQSVLWGASGKSGDWISTVNGILSLSEEAAAAPQKATSRAWRQDLSRLYDAAHQFSYDAKVTADPAGKHVMGAAFHLAGALRSVREVATQYKKGKHAEGEEKARHVLRITNGVASEVLRAVPAEDLTSLTAALVKDWKALQEATAARREEEKRSHTLQPVRLEDFGIIAEGYGILPRPMPSETPPTATTTDPHELLREMDEAYLAFRTRARARLAELLNSLAGRTFPSLQAKQTIASRIRQILQRLELRIACPKCQQPALLRAAAAGNAKHGVFQFQHSTRTNHGGSGDFPSSLALVDAPEDRRAKAASTIAS